MTHGAIPEDEIWKPIPSFPIYEASSLGRIRRVGFNKRKRKPGVLAVCIGGHGYPNYRLVRGDKVVSACGHQLVCEAFHGPAPSPAHEVAHNDGVRSNCRADNVRWATRAENHADKKIHGTNRQGESIPWSRLTADQVRDIRGLLGEGRSPLGISRLYGVSEGAINGIRIGRNWKHLEQAQ